MITPYHAKLFAYELTSKPGADVPDRIARALHDAKVDLNPHQVNAALFALKNPLSQGVILADEVGLGKTIEAGLLISQYWAEGKRSILIIAPKSLRHQWKDELDRLFFLKSDVLNSAIYRKIKKSGENDPFDRNEKIIITNEHFVDAYSTQIKLYKWDLVIIDEAHKLRNVWKKSRTQAKRAKSVRDAVRGFNKALLTATPMQNNLMELYGLVSFIDDYILGTPESFAATFCNVPEEQREERLIELRHRMSRFFNRELRQNVKDYVPYTNRNPMTFTYEPSVDEEKLRIGFEDFLRRPIIHSIPTSALPLLKLIYLKLLASSTFALKNSLLNLYCRLMWLSVNLNNRELYEKLYSDIKIKLTNSDGTRADELERFEKRLFKGVISKTFDALRERAEAALAEFELTDEESEISATYEETDSEDDDQDTQEEVLHPTDEIEEEAKLILSFITTSREISENKKADSLIEALNQQFAKAKSEGWPEKAVIFTEFRTTQNYVLKALERMGLNLKSDVVIFNGDSGDTEERKSLVSEFKQNKKIFLTTEAGSEGLNLQFCNLIINYDLPWNPQRIEQRIGRCHRYGQPLDVIVVNFVNKKNGADVRVLELLQEKFNLFKGAFGASDEVLGQIESGHDFEKEILKIYLACRTPEEIKSAFNDLSEKLKSKIDKSMTDAKKLLLENFDEEVQAKLKFREEQTKKTVDEFSRKFNTIVEFGFDGLGIEAKDGVFEVTSPNGQITEGRYSTDLSSEATPILTNNSLGELFLAKAKSSSTPPQILEFDLSNYENTISLLESLSGESGILAAYHAKLSAFRDEDCILLAGATQEGKSISAEVISKLFRLNARPTTGQLSEVNLKKVEANIKSELEALNLKLAEKNKVVFHEEIDRLDAWAEDIKLSLEIEIKQLDQEIKTLKTASKKMSNLEETVQAKRHIKNLEAKRNEKRKELFSSQDRIDQEKESVLNRIEQNMNIKTELTEIFTIGWKVV
ncbi:hypothetical protein AZI86_05245 [Bdellovibrio bacteriovorus]|uniref:DEAD/DEAH box helicase n=1 Tax=Bdellovibrio bacteriovorus TaxID=959 RepID=A0A150WPP2_BDEBC|nr:SNF2-related protein [Bdellovibrio bacteriovorus]KYG66452.1 hypothetical protein AZI86_05245 [Bdellovibrio bacteriovorus]